MRDAAEALPPTRPRSPTSKRGMNTRHATRNHAQELSIVEKAAKRGYKRARKLALA